jgi:hypothetical protein
MERKQVLTLIQESRGLLASASMEQKLKLMKTIKESLRVLKENKQEKTSVSKNADYLDEK